MPIATSVASRAAQSVTLATFNRITLSDGNVYTLVTPYCRAYYYNVFNLGPCTVYIRGDADPAVDDPQSEVLPPGCADNLILVGDGTVGLRFLAGPPCLPGFGRAFPPCAGGSPGAGCAATITVRLVQAG